MIPITPSKLCYCTKSSRCLGDKRGIERYGFTVPMDETLAQAAIDLSGRFYLKFVGEFPESMVATCQLIW